MDKKKKISLVVMIIGIVTVVAGVVFLVLNLISKPAVPDGEYLVSAKEWKLEDGTNCADGVPAESSGEAAVTNCVGRDSVIWKFTEAGKGTLTTNNHTNDYEFIWALEGKDELKMEIKWLYDIDKEYTYKLDKQKGTLTLSGDGEDFVFVAEFDNAE